MYNRYLDQGQSPARPDAPPRDDPPREPVHIRAPQAQPSGGASLLSGAVGGLGELLGGLFKGISAERFDTGDILLVLIILLLFLDGDDLDIVITLGLMLLLGLGE